MSLRSTTASAHRALCLRQLSESRHCAESSCRSGALVQRLAAELDALDAELLPPVGLIRDDLGKHPLGLVPSPEELDHLLDLGANDSPDDHASKTSPSAGSTLTTSTPWTSS
jgi:hypothetical protein